jgi:hypothetical protein
VASPIWRWTARSLVRSTPATSAAIARNAMSCSRTRDSARAACFRASSPARASARACAACAAAITCWVFSISSTIAARAAVSASLKPTTPFEDMF